MKALRLVSILILLFSLSIFTALYATIYYSQGNLAPNLVASWNSQRNGSGSAPANFTSGDTFAIQNTHNMVSTATWAISGGTSSKLHIETGGILQADRSITLALTTTFQMDAGSKYIQNVSMGMNSTIFRGIEVFDPTSTIEIQVHPSGTSEPTSPGYGNLTINIPTGTSLGWAGDLTAVQGNLTILETGTGTTRHALTAGTDINVNIGGNFIVSGGNFWFSSGTGTVNMTVGGNVSLSGSSTVLNLANSSGAGTLNIVGNFTMTGGTLSEEGNSSGTINFAGTTAQLISISGSPTISNTVNFAVNNNAIAEFETATTVLSGSIGTFMANSGSTLIIKHADGITSTGAVGCIQTTGTRTFSTAANYIYQGSAAQVTGSGLPATVNNLTINNASGVTLTGSITVNGVLTQTTGVITGSQNPDGYTSASLNRINIAESGANMTSFSLVTSVVPANYPARIARQWVITQSGASLNKTITFYWDAADDYNYTWGSNIPAVWKGITQYTTTLGNYDVTSPIRWVRVSNIPVTSTKDTYKIGRLDDGTLPVELSSFTAIATAQMFVNLQWTTESETNNLGFNVFRSYDSNIANAIRVNYQIIGGTNTSTTQNYSFVDNAVEPETTYYYWLQMLDLDGTSHFSTFISVTTDIPSTPVVQATILGNAYPNPFNLSTSTSIEMDVKTGETATLTIFNLLGQTVKTYIRQAGSHKITWNARNENGVACGSGIYFYKLSSPSVNITKKMMIVK
jgi:hypothetical protein